MFYREVRIERTGWRDQGLENLLMENKIYVPESFLVTEYNYGKSVAIIEYKAKGRCNPNQRLVQYCKLRKNQEFYFIVRFTYERKEEKYRIKKYSVYPGNESAREFIKKEYHGDEKNCRCILNEKEYIGFLYKIRNNEKSIYYQKAMDDYEEWFTLNQPYLNDRSIISSRHRSYAFDVPAADIDCMLCDSKNIPYLFVEFKEGSKEKPNCFIKENMRERALSPSARRKFGLRAIMDLGNGCKDPIPVIATEYNLKEKLFKVFAFNEKAEECSLIDMNQEEYFSYIKNPKNFRKKLKKVS